MQNYSLFEKIGILFSIIKTSPLFIISFIIGIILITMMFLDLKTTKKIREKLLIVIWISVMIFIGIRYCNYLIKISDNLVEEIFTAIYFPNIAIYTIIIITVNIALIIGLLKKKMTTSYKVANVFTTVVIDFLFILILETIIKNKIDVYETLTVYSNKDLLTLIELSSGMYTAWLFVVALIRIVEKSIPEEKIVKDEIKESEKIEIPISCDLVYESPKYNSYEHNYVPKEKQVSYDTYDYTGIFFQKPSEYLETIEPVKVEKNEQSIISDTVSKIEDSYIDTSIVNQEINEKTNKSFNLKNKLSNLFESKKVDASNDTITNEYENIIEENEVEAPNILVNEPQIINQIVETKEETYKENKLNTIIESFNKLFESKKVEDTKVIIPNILVDQVEVENNNFEKVDDKSNIKETLSTIFEDNDSPLFIPEVEQTKVIEKDTKTNIPKFNIKETFNNLFEHKKVEETKEEFYRIPLFESLSDDALLNCFVPVETKKEESLISKLENRPTIDTIDNVTIKLDGENLLNKYNSGEQLDVIEYKILKEYLMSKQGN
ncbi:MAG: hypothetical protein PUA68_05255 [Bacilli bacterium]|nr:hypothetical protein [Bacilli bacterium]